MSAFSGRLPFLLPIIAIINIFNFFFFFKRQRHRFSSICQHQAPTLSPSTLLAALGAVSSPSTSINSIWPLQVGWLGHCAASATSPLFPALLAIYQSLFINFASIIAYQFHLPFYLFIIAFFFFALFPAFLWVRPGAPRQDRHRLAGPPRGAPGSAYPGCLPSSSGSAGGHAPTTTIFTTVELMELDGWLMVVGAPCAAAHSAPAGIAHLQLCYSFKHYSFKSHHHHRSVAVLNIVA